LGRTMQEPVQYKDNGVLLGSSYCSGYVDSSGQWSSGFYCPYSGDTSQVFCCGTHRHKYCCTKEEDIIQEEEEGFSLLVGVMAGTLMALLMLIITSCIYCSWCPGYRGKGSREPRSSWNRLPHMSSMQSGVSNIYSQGSDPTHYNPPDNMVQVQIQDNQEMLKHSNQEMSSTLLVTPSQDYVTGVCTEYGFTQPDHPPPYHILPRGSYLIIPQDTPDLLSGSLSQPEPGLHALVKAEREEEELFNSTKF